MKRTLDFVSLAALALIAAITVLALAGPNRLPDRIPVHFDGSGHANGWASPFALVGLPAGALVLYALMSLVSRYPGAFNFPTRVTAANRRRLEALALQMIAWLKAEMMCLLLWVQHFTIQAARSGRGVLPLAFMPITLGIVLGTIAVYFVQFRRS